MRKILLCLMLSGLAQEIHAASEKRTVTKLNSSTVRVEIVTKERDSTQASNYVDAKENSMFLNAMKRDRTSTLAKLKAKIEMDFCNQNSRPGTDWIDGCGEVTFTKEVRTSFAKEGWMSGIATYSFFVGFTSDGSGRHFDATHLATFTERVDAQTKNSGDYSGVILKTLEMGKIKEIEMP